MKVPAEVQFAQKLAANEPTDRDRGIKKLRRWFQSRAAGNVPFQEDELLRIWKGLFYCYWMSDKPLVQEELAVNVASLIDSFGNEEPTLIFMKTFFKTMGREWFGIDKWRMDKFMMMVRRFVRQIFKYNKKMAWDLELTEKISDIVGENLILANINDTSLGLQMHVTDVFLEELAKVGGEDLDQAVLDLYLEPFFKVVSVGRECRLRDHVVERVFSHLIRQSDPGLEWEMDKEVESLGNIEIIEGDEEEGDDDDVDMDEEEQDTNGKVEDPRAGRVDVEIPQLKLDYQQMSEKFFELGSDDKTMVANRNILYRLSKNFKDVANDVFPLGDDTSDEEPSEKFNVDESVAALVKKEDKIRRKNAKTKEEFSLWKKEQKKKFNQEKAEENGLDDEPEENGFHDDEDEFGSDNDLKRKQTDEEPEESPETKRARTETAALNKKDKARKRKQEMKRIKRERVLAESIRAGEEARKSQLLIQADLEIKSTMDPIKELPVDRPIKKSKKSKKKNKEVTEPAEPTEDIVLNGHTTNQTKQKSESPKKEVMVGKKCRTDVSEVQKGESKSEKKKKKKNKNKGEVNNSLNESSLEKNNIDVSASATPQKSSMKEKKIKKDLISESIAISTPEGLSKKKKKILSETFTSSTPNMEKKLVPQVSPSISAPLEGSKKKKTKKNKAETSPDAQIVSKPLEGSKKKKNKNTESSEKENVLISTPLEGSKKKKKAKAEKVVNVAMKLFDESADWGTPEDQENGSSASVVEAAPSKGFKGFESPKVSTPKSHTAVFLKKAMSKSATPKKKLSKIEKLKATNSASEGRSKKVNFVLTRNTSQEISDLYTSIAASPGIPHDPARNPNKSLLRVKTGVLDKSIELHPVQLNTQLNSISKKGRKLVGKNMRMKASQFF